MPAIPVIAIFDVGKTNKKLFLLDDQYRIVWEKSRTLEQTTDDDGDPCEDLQQLTDWIYSCEAMLSDLVDFEIRAVNFTAYGASLVHVGEGEWPVAPLYNYLKPYPAALKEKLYDSYGGALGFSMQTASPVLGSLNSGMQLYRIREQGPELFNKIKYSLHLPQYLSFLYTGVAASEITSIGCHTQLWDFSRGHYHEWVYREGIIGKLPPLLPSTVVQPLQQPVGTTFSGTPAAGLGLHDSSAAMIPYLEIFREPFVLISTGTWCISMNPFNHVPLTAVELQQDCLCYLSYQGRPVKASRLFAGYEYDQQVKKLAAYFNVHPAYANTVAFDPAIVSLLKKQSGDRGSKQDLDQDLDQDFDHAYHRLMMDIMERQVESTRLVLQGTDVSRIFVDGGFGKNRVYMHLLAKAFPSIRIYAADMAQATAVGAAMAIHPHWNSRPLPGDIFALKYFPAISASG
jgi:L-fuculokinase